MGRLTASVGEGTRAAEALVSLPVIDKLLTSLLEEDSILIAILCYDVGIKWTISKVYLLFYLLFKLRLDACQVYLFTGEYYGLKLLAIIAQTVYQDFGRRLTAIACNCQGNRVRNSYHRKLSRDEQRRTLPVVGDTGKICDKKLFILLRRVGNSDTSLLDSTTSKL